MAGIQLTGRPAARADLDSSMVPMINVVFLLLLFFLVSGSLAEVIESGLVLPGSLHNAGGPVESRYLIISPKGKLIWEGRELTFAELAARWRQDGGTIPEPLSIRADANLRAEHLLSLMDQLTALGVKRCILVTTVKQRE